MQRGQEEKISELVSILGCTADAARSALEDCDFDSCQAADFLLSRQAGATASVGNEAANSARDENMDASCDGDSSDSDIILRTRRKLSGSVTTTTAAKKEKSSSIESAVCMSL